MFNYRSTKFKPTSLQATVFDSSFECIVNLTRLKSGQMGEVYCKNQADMQVKRWRD